MVFLAQNSKSKHHHQIQHIQISHGTNFHLKNKILVIWIKFAQKGYFQSKTEKVINHRIQICKYLANIWRIF